MKNASVLLSGLSCILYPVFLWALSNGVFFVISRLGWAPLARTFQTLSPPLGQKFATVSARINGYNYNNCLTVIVASEGLWMQPKRFFRAFHPALLIPWSAFSPLKEKKVLWVTRAATTVSTPDGKQIRIMLAPPALGDAIRQQLRNYTNTSGRGPWGG